jgi:preprotein translocase subunit Sec61beta
MVIIKKMAKDNVRMPSSQGGLVSYKDEYNSALMIKPTTVVLLIILVIVLEIMLHAGFF